MERRVVCLCLLFVASALVAKQCVRKGVHWLPGGNRCCICCGCDDVNVTFGVCSA